MRSKKGEGEGAFLDFANEGPFIPYLRVISLQGAKRVARRAPRGGWLAAFAPVILKAAHGFVAVTGYFEDASVLDHHLSAPLTWTARH